MTKAISFMRMLSVVALVSSIVFGGVPAKASVLEQTKDVAGFSVSYKVVLPDRLRRDQGISGDYRVWWRSAYDEHR